MKINPQSVYDITLEEAVNNIVRLGHLRTIVFEGHMGSGKSQMLGMVGKKLPKHKLFYFDVTTKFDSGDVMIPMLKSIDGNDCVRFATNEELGIHLSGEKIIVMLDEINKGNDSLKNSLNRFMYERAIGSYELHPESIVFATTNLSEENLGDRTLPHQRNRVTYCRLKKPTSEQWIEYGILRGLNELVLGWVKQNPDLFQCFTQCASPKDNEFIYHPQGGSRSFVTGRSLEAASQIMNEAEYLTDNSIYNMLFGTIGEAATMSFMAFAKMAKELPSIEEIKADPTTAIVPTTAAGQCLVIHRTLRVIKDMPEILDAWMDYLGRLPRELQGMYVHSVFQKDYHSRALVATNGKFGEWCRLNGHIFKKDVGE
jgi:hypothetical protein